MGQTVYLVCGVPGSGKSWVCRQLKDKFNYIAHDRCWTHPTAKPTNDHDPQWPTGAKSTHLETIISQVKQSDKPVLTECPFAERELKESLEASGVKVVPFFVIEPAHVIASRYFNREKKACPQNVLTRADTIKKRAKEWEAVSGSSEAILNILRAQTV